MIRLISFGDHLEKGHYKVHSRFKQVVNFVSGNHLVAVVHPLVGGGPFNLVVDGVDVMVLNHLTIKDDSFSLNDEIIPFDASKKYDSEIELNGFDEQLFKANLHFLEETLVQHAPDKSLAFLLDETRRHYLKTSYEMELVRRFDAAMKCFNSSDTTRAVRLIKGVGFGLTPSGDDFIAGWLQALNLTGKIFQTDPSAVINKVYRESQSNNILTDSFLFASSNGWLSETFKSLILSLLTKDKKEIHGTGRIVMSHGSTSGADWCVGFMFGLKYI